MLNSQEGNNKFQLSGQSRLDGWTGGDAKLCGGRCGENFGKEAIAFPKKAIPIPVLLWNGEPRDTDYLSLGFPEISITAAEPGFRGDGTSEQET